MGCDAINLSLGTSSPGFVDPAGSGVAYAERLFQSLTQTDTVVTISAGNAYSAGFQSATGTDLHRTSDPDVDTVGSPGSYENALTVASVTNSGLTGPYLSMGQINASYTAVGSAPSGLESWESLDAGGEGTEYPFVFLGDPTSDTDTRKYAMSQKRLQRAGRDRQNCPGFPGYQRFLGKAQLCGQSRGQGRDNL